MDVKKQNILFLSHASLSTGFVVGSHQLGKCLSPNNFVFHVSSPVTPFHLLKGKAGISKLYNSFFPKKIDSFGFTDFIPLVPFPYGILRILDYLNDIFVFLYFRVFKIPTNFDITLIDQPSLVGFFKHFVKSERMVYRPTDIYKNMGGEKYIEHEIRSVKLSDGVIATSQEVMNALKLNPSKPKLVVENGVDIDFFKQEYIPRDRNGLVYVGAVDFRFDIEFIASLAKLLPNEKIDIYGPILVDIQPFTNIPNLNFLGKLDYKSVPNTLSRYKFGLLPLNAHPANIGRSPMKLYEYQAVGLICLVPKLKKYELLAGETILIYKDSVEAVSLIENNSKRNINEYYEACIVRAKNESWKSKTNKIVKFINSLSHDKAD